MNLSPFGGQKQELFGMSESLYGSGELLVQPG